MAPKAAAEKKPKTGTLAAFNILYELRVRLSEKLSRLPLGYFTKKTRLWKFQ